MRQQLKKSDDAGLQGWSQPAAPVQAKSQKPGSFEGQGYRPALARHSLGGIAVDHKASNAESSARKPNGAGLPSQISPSSPIQTQHSVAPRSTNVIQRVILDEEKLKGWKRLAQPYRKPEYPGLDIVGMKSTLHHVIPLNQLLRFVSVAYEKDREVLELILKAAVTTMMSNSPIVERGEIKGQQGQGDQTRESLYEELRKKEGSDQANSAAMDAIITAFSWMPGNLFLGPVNELRTDDPDDLFEEHAQNAVGIEKFEQLKTASALIEEYVNPGSDRSTGDLARQIEALLVPVAEQSEHFPYRADVWEQSPTEPNKKKLVGAPESPQKGRLENAKKGRKGRGAAAKN